jgi:hypothetical protein
MYRERRLFPAVLRLPGRGFNEGSMTQTQAQRWRRQRGSALLLTLLLTLADAVALEMRRAPHADLTFLAETARATAALNGYRHGADSVSVQVEQLDGKTSILLERDAGVFFMRMVRSQPVAIRARATVPTGVDKAGL